MDTSELVIVIVLLLLVAGLFVLALAETSLLQVRRSAAEVEAEAGDRQAAGLLALLDDLPRVLNAVLLTVLLAQVTAATMAGELARDWFGGTGATIATATVTVVLFVYGEAVPKTIAVRNPFPVARRLAAPVRWLSAILRPIVSLLVRFADLQSRGSARDTVTSVSEAELRLLADEAAEKGQIEESDAELIERSFDFGDRQVGEILVPRDRVVAVPSHASVADALQTAIAAGHRRLLVHDGGIDHITGFVRLRDLAAAVTSEPETTVSTRTRTVLTVSKSSPVTDLLQRMQQARCHMAVVEAPGGLIEGIVTIEDVVEELVGTIDDI
jgi:CBS domain containing-hemolysin-like protein